MMKQPPGGATVDQGPQRTFIDLSDDPHQNPIFNFPMLLIFSTDNIRISTWTKCTVYHWRPAAIPSSITNLPVQASRSFAWESCHDTSDCSVAEIPDPVPSSVGFTMFSTTCATVWQSLRLQQVILSRARRDCRLLWRNRCVLAVALAAFPLSGRADSCCFFTEFSTPNLCRRASESTTETAPCRHCSHARYFPVRVLSLVLQLQMLPSAQRALSRGQWPFSCDKSVRAATCRHIYAC